MQQPDPLAVLKLRIFLGKNEIIDKKSIVKIAGVDLYLFMAAQPGFPREDLSEEHGLHWNYRTLRNWMQAHKGLQAAYNEGKRLVNPSGMAYEQEVRTR